MVLNLIYVKTVVLHASLLILEQVKLVTRFNNPENSLLVLIIMHSMLLQDVNLDKYCNQILVITNAANALFEWQS